MHESGTCYIYITDLPVEKYTIVFYFCTPHYVASGQLFIATEAEGFGSIMDTSSSQAEDAVLSQDGFASNT